MRLAKAAPPLRSLIDPEDARFLNPSNMPAAIQDFCRETRQPVPNSEGALIRCALESLALKYQTVLSCIEEATGNRVEIIAHPLWNTDHPNFFGPQLAGAYAQAVAAGCQVTVRSILELLRRPF